MQKQTNRFCRWQILEKDFSLFPSSSRPVLPYPGEETSHRHNDTNSDQWVFATCHVGSQFIPYNCFAHFASSVSCTYYGLHCAQCQRRQWDELLDRLENDGDSESSAVEQLAKSGGFELDCFKSQVAAIINTESHKHETSRKTVVVFLQGHCWFLSKRRKLYSDVSKQSCIRDHNLKTK